MIHIAYSISHTAYTIQYIVYSTWHTVHGKQCITYNICVYTPTEQCSTLLASHTSQKGLNEDAALRLQLAVEVSEYCPDNPEHNLEVRRLECRLTGGVQQVL